MESEARYALVGTVVLVLIAAMVVAVGARGAIRNGAGGEFLVSRPAGQPTIDETRWLRPAGVPRRLTGLAWAQLRGTRHSPRPVSSNQ